jgi:hypothetical protein
VVLLALATTVLATAWLVRHALSGGPRLTQDQARWVVSLTEFPGLVRSALGQLTRGSDGVPGQLLINKTATPSSNWVRSFPQVKDDGYLLLSGLDPASRQTQVSLIRIADGVALARWTPDWPRVFDQLAARTQRPLGDPMAAQAAHPLLLPDGDIIFNTGQALVRMSPCSRLPVWVSGEPFHHSLELDERGMVWGASLSNDGYADYAWLKGKALDDAIAQVSPDGHLISRTSVARILRDNGLEALLLGSAGTLVNDDPLHLNEVQVAHNTTRHWQLGDLLLSARHLSTVLLYRPSTQKVIWYRTGPWLNQHSAEFVDDHRISVFDNHVVASAPKEAAFLRAGDANRVQVYDFDTGEVSEPFAALLADAHLLTVTGGRARILPDGGLFVEETEQGRHLRFTRDSLLWTRVNDFDQDHVGMVSWSRYLTPQEARQPLNALQARACTAPAAKP